MTESAVCQDCFYKYRTEQHILCQHGGKKVHVTWNENAGRQETTVKSMRPFPESLRGRVKNYVAMCDPYRGTCRREGCTFAHGKAEQKAWNQILRQNQQISAPNHMWPSHGQLPGNQVSHWQQRPLPAPDPWPDLHLQMQQPPLHYNHYNHAYVQSFSSTYGAPMRLASESAQSPRSVPQQASVHSGQRADSYPASKETFEGRLEADLELAEIQVELGRRNYKRKFHHLICWEEKQHIEILAQKCDRQCNLALYSSSNPPNWIRSTYDYPVRYGYLDNVSTDQIAYATQASEAAFIVPYDERLAEVKLEILRENYEHSDARMYVAFKESDSYNLSVMLSKPLPLGEVTIQGIFVEFEVKHSYFNSLVKAINGLPPEMIRRIMPTPDSFLPLHDVYDDLVASLLPREVGIDGENQWKALHAILSVDRTSPPLLINGSFGAGKTQVLAVATHCLIQYGQKYRQPVRVLICAHHQASADHFIEKYFGPMFRHAKNVKLIRVTSTSYRVKSSQFYGYYVTSRALQAYHDFDIPNYLIIVTTFLTAPSLQRKFRGNIFTHILMDEGSQSREPEAIAPLCLAGPETKIVIAGDSHQVGPALLVLGDEARENGLKYSLLERLQTLYQQYGGLALQHMVSLNTNYRCHPELVKIPNQLFYNSQIKSCTPSSSGSYPLRFLCSSITEQTDCEREATLLLNQVWQFVMSNWPFGYTDRDLRNICMVMATRTQLVTARRLAKEKFKELKCIKMLTVYDIQGQEFQALFLSTTEPVDSAGNTTNPTKSPCDPYVFNTALTRSKSQVVVVGNPVALLRIEGHMVTQYGRKAQCWSSFLKLCLENKSFEIPSTVGKERKEFELRLRVNLFQDEASKTQLANFLALRNDMKQPPPPSSVRHIPVSSAKPPKHTSSGASSASPSKPRSSKQQQNSPSTGCSAFQRPAVPVPPPPAKHAPGTQHPSVSKQQQSSPPVKRAPAAQHPSVSISSKLQQSSPLVKHAPASRHPSVSASSKPQQTTNIPANVFGKPNKKKGDSEIPKNSLDTSDSLNGFVDSQFPSLASAAKVKISKKEARKIAAKEKRDVSERLASSISSSNVSVPASHSSFYNKYKDRLESHGHILKEPLTADNYKEKFHFLLTWEEKEHDKQLAERCNKVYEVVIYQPGYSPIGLRYEEEAKYDRFGYITSTDGESLSHASQASQGVFIILENSSFVHGRNVHAIVPGKANVNAITFGLKERDSKQLRKGGHSFNAEIKFELKHSYFEQLHKAIHHLPIEVVQRLNPTEEMLSSFEPNQSDYIFGKPPYDNIELDQEVQMKALYGAFRAASHALPVLIAGPFGTGKTRLLARAAYEILKRKSSRVLICVHHQTSADTFVQIFTEMKKNGWEINVIRVVPNRSYINHDREGKHGVSVKARHDLTQHDLENNRLVVTTLGGAPGLFFKLPADKGRGFFTDILIDEGAQTREPETVGPLTLAGRFTRIIIAGDHCQVGPKSLVLGKEAWSNELGVSLLERLHSLYDNSDLPSNSLCMTLLTNYRCHSGILMLPSSLYYHSTLLCRVPDSTAHHLAPFPLTFVCSDIKQDLQGTSGTNENEADVIFKEVQKYFWRWPKHWDKRNKRVCIASPSADQCSLFWKKKKKQQLDCEIEIKKAYDIQGTEFLAIFVSTVELTTANAEPINTTKTLCDRYIFNTVLTRSRALVVVVGNPFQLLKMEATMVQKYGDSYRTWTPYIKQCIECDTFSYADSVKKADPSTFVQATHQLYKCVYADTAASENSLATKPLDSIIKAYKRLLESTPACQKAKLSLTGSKDARLTWSISEDRGHEKPSQREEDYSDRYLCNLKIYTYRKAEAIPYDGSKRIVKFQGAKNRRGAFDGDTVEVGVFADSPPGKCYGRVLKVTKRGSDLKYICRVSHHDPIIFYPIDRKSPKLINLPRLSRDLLKKKERDEINHSDLKSNDVVVFYPSIESEGDDVPLPQIAQVIPLAVARNMLFLVSFVRWEDKYPSPLGIVTGAYRKGHTLYNAERLLKFVHSVEYNSDNDNFSISDARRDDTLDLYDRVFTIDPEDAQNLDDALSIVYLGTDKTGHKVYQLGVHIVNAAKYILPDSEEDKSARSKSISVYGGDKGKIMHMLHSSTTRSNLSLHPERLRDVITVTCTATIASSQIDFGTVSIEPAQIISSIQLTYKQAQDIMDGTTPAKCVTKVREFDMDAKNPTLQESLKLLLAIAKGKRQHRLGNAAFTYDVNEMNEAYCWQAHMLVEELMIWANNEVAKYIHSRYPDAALLRRQAAPNEEKKEAIVDNNHSVMPFSFHLSQYLPDRPAPPSVDIAIPHDTLKLISAALKKGDSNLLAHLLSSDRLYPQLAAVCSEFRSISLRGEYCCTNEQDQPETFPYHHDSLHLDQYTHFTSPMRRYIDIQVQRMLLEVSSQQACGTAFDPEKQTELCLVLNAKKKNATDYERSLKSVRFGNELAKSSAVCTAFISKEEKSSLELTFPDLDLSHFPFQAKSLRITNFIASSKEADLYTWKVHITTLRSDLAAELLSLPGISVSQFQSEDHQDLVTAFSCLMDGLSLDTKKVGISRTSSVVKISPDDWLKALEFVKDPSKEKMECIKEILPEISPLSTASNSQFLDTADKMYPFLDCNVMASLQQSDVLKLWLTWSMREPVISPIIQVVEVSPLLRICIQHNSHPAECFSDPNLSKASKQYYLNIKEYIELWKAVLLAEAAEKSVKESQPIIIRDVTLQWPELKIPDKCIEEIYFVPVDSIKIILPQHFVEHCYEFFRIGVGDLICVRYPHESARAVYHFVVHRVEEQEEEIVVSMKPIGEINCRVSEVMKNKLKLEKLTCEVQLVPLSVSYRKVFRGLLDLAKDEKVSALSQAVAVDCDQIRGQTHSQTSTTIAKQDELATSISKWSPKSGNDQTDLNRWQKRAMKMALHEPFQLIQGPPGTGKSVTGAHIAYIFAKLNRNFDTHKCVLYCGPSNKSVDVVFEKFVHLLKARDLDLKILRIYSSTVERKDFPGPKYHTMLRNPDVQCPGWAKPYALHHLIRQPGQSEELAELEKEIREKRGRGEIATGRLCNVYRKVLQEAETSFLSKEKFEVIFCTCNEASGGRLRKYKNLAPRQCIIDECGMAYEPETIVPISLCEHVVLIGDHQQLQPVIDYQPAKDCGLTTSLFERYARYHEDFIFTLRTQYRMHEAICAFPSEEFYNGQLETAESVKQRPESARLDRFWPRGNRTPIMFVDIVGEEGQEKTGSSKTETKVGVDSKHNKKEAELVIEIVKTLHHRHGVAVSEMAVLSPYSAQKSKILEMVKELRGELGKLKVASITESQGDEYGIVILSTVRSQPLDEIRYKHYVQPDRTWMNENLGFITDRHQINVGITRSKYGLVITGNKTLLEYNATWGNLLEHYEEMGCVVDASRFLQRHIA